MDKASLPKIIEALQKFGELSGADFRSWIWDLQQADKLWDRCPFKEGDKAVLAKTPDIRPETSPGWMSSKHFLVEGALATVASVGFYDGQFRFGLMFDNETWIDREGIQRPVDNQYVYTFGEKWIKPA